ncbi:O91 family O-antigen polymerase [Hafnia paralvei]
MQNKKVTFPQISEVTKGSEKITSWLFAFFAVLSLWPFFSWKWPVIPISFIILAYFAYGCSLLFLYRRNFSLSGFFVFIVLFFVFLIFSLRPGGAPPWFNYYSFFSLLILLLPINKILDVAARFRILFAFSLIPGIIVYVLLLAGFDLPYTVLEAHNELKESLGIFYRDYGVTLALSHLILEVGNSTIIRFSGIYDEPGLLGTISALFLLADKFNMKSKINIILLISGVISVSLVFYIFTIVGFLMQSNKKVIGIIFIIVLGVGVYNTPIYDNYLAKRFETSSSDGVIADNRVSDCFKAEYEKFASSDSEVQLLGEGNNAHLSTMCDVSSYKMYIYDYGYIGILVIAIALIIQYTYPLLVTGNTFRYIKSSLFFVFCFFISYYQRPVLFNLAFCLIFYYSISLYFSKQYNSKI